MIDLLSDFVTKFNKLGIEYMVTGSFAMSAYGEIRFTRDIDVVIQMTEAHIEDCVAAFKADYYVSEQAIKRALRQASMFNLISNVHGGKIDCIVMKDSPFARESFGHRSKVRVADTEFWVISKEDLIVSKLSWARDTNSPTRIKDIVNLTSSEYDSEYVKRWIDEIGLCDIWDEVERWRTLQKKTSA